MHSKRIQFLVIIVIFLLSIAAFEGTAYNDASTVQTQPVNNIQSPQLPHSFAFVSRFTSGGNYSDYGWTLLGGVSTILISKSMNYYGEPSLELSNKTNLFTDQNITTGGQVTSFQFAINAAFGRGSFSITNSDGHSIASISVSGRNVTISTNKSNSSPTGMMPLTSPPKEGWSLISGNLYNDSNGNGSDWNLQIFVDNTISVFANLSAPLGYSYGGIEISSLAGHIYFTDIVFSSYKMTQFIPGYNNMEGYGQGSGLIAHLLKPFQILHTNIVLDNWSVPRLSSLSFQINALNYSAALNPTAKGFFQLGIDLDPKGRIAPWYVGGKDAIAVYFPTHAQEGVFPGFITPNYTLLGLTIEYIPTEGKIFFQILDYNVSGSARYWNATVAYNGPEFYATYTQLETPNMSQSQLTRYHFNGTMTNITYGSDFSSMSPLGNGYMLPYSINAPTVWSFTYYDGNSAGYHQIG